MSRNRSRSPLTYDATATLDARSPAPGTLSRGEQFQVEGTPTGPRWEGVIAVEGEPTGDGRLIERGALRWEDGPWPLMWVREQGEGHDGATVVGTIETIEREGRMIRGTGRLDAGGEAGREVIRQVQDGLLSGISVDLDDVDLEIRVAQELLDVPMMVDPVEESLDEGEEVDEDGRVTVMEIKADDELMVTTDARVRGATIVATPAFASTSIGLQTDDEDEDEEAPPVPTGDEVEDEEEEEEVVVASLPGLRLTASADVGEAPPRAWFEDPGFEEPTPVRIQDDGRILGHLALWGTCHTAYRDTCVEPPASDTGYAYFHVGATRTADGSEVPTGVLTMDTLHAGRRMSARDTLAHYEHTGMAAADVRAGEDEWGIWITGRIRPGLTDKAREVLRAAPLSGDWRRIGGNLELVAALAVNTPGFPVPRPQAMVAGGSVQTLQHAGAIPRETAFGGMLSADDLEALRRIARRERERAAAAQERADRARLQVLAASAATRVHEYGCNCGKSKKQSADELGSRTASSPRPTRSGRWAWIDSNGRKRLFHSKLEAEAAQARAGGSGRVERT